MQTSANQTPAPAVRVGVIEGDGIGPELTASATAVLEAGLAQDGLRAEFHHEEGGARAFLRHGTALPDGTLERLRRYDGVLKGPVGLPDVRHPDGTEAGLLGGLLRGGLDAYANLRPVRLLPGVTGPTRHRPEDIDYLIVRENTEGLYLSRGCGVRNDRAASDQLLVTREGVERIARRALDLARTRRGAPADGVHRVTCVHKANVLRSFAFFRDVFDEVAAGYPDVAAEHMYADAAAAALVADPARFDVLVMENLLGDILSDLGAATAGGLGMCPSGNMGDTAAYFEPIHGSAPDIAGTGTANPTSQILSAALLLDHTGHTGPARSVRTAVAAAYASGAVRLDGLGRPRGGTAAVTEAVMERLGDSGSP